jgi:fatty-acyl-CoA synthase
MMRVNDLLARRAQLTPERVAVVEVATGRRYTYAELNDRAERVAGFMQQLGVGEGDRVAILAHNGVAYVDLLYGLGRIGAILAPLNWRLVARELTYIVNDCQPRVLIYGPEFAAPVAELRPLVQVPVYVSLEEAAVAEAVSYKKGLAAATAPPGQPAGDDEDICCILYTSGTTGRPKGALIPHRQVFWNCINTVISWGLSEGDVSPILTPMFHAGGLFVFLAPLLYAGGRVVLARTLDVDESLRTITREQCTVILGVPTLFQLWLQSPVLPEVDFQHVRWFISGGAPCPVALIAAWREATGIILRQGYGLTEVGVNCFAMTNEEAVARAGSVGKPIFHSRMRIVGEDGQDVPVDQVGELAIAGPHVCAGYWRNPEATAQSLRDGWFHTGDMARMDAEGFYYIAGRYKDMLISGGENVYAAEVEAIFLEHPAVAEAALIGKPDAKWGEVGLMVVVLRPGAAATAEELVAFCQGRLARYKIPKEVVFATDLPTSPYGKVLKAELRRRYVRR